MGCSASKPIMEKPPTFGEWNGETYGAYSTYENESKSSTDSFWTCDKNATQTIQFSKIGKGSEAVSPATTVSAMFKDACSKSGNKPFLRVEDVPSTCARGETPPASKPVEEWNCRTYSQTYDECRNVAKGYMSLGLAAMDAVTIYGFNSPEWVMAELACVLAGGIAAGIYPSDTAEQVTFKAKHSGAVIAVVQNKSKAEMFLNAKKDLPKLKAIIVWDTSDGVPAETGGVKIMSWNDLVEQGSSSAADADLDSRMDAQKPGQCCAYIYTSGTTGMPKAVMISHDNILFESAAANNLIAGMGEDANKGKKKEKNRKIRYFYH